MVRTRVQLSLIATLVCACSGGEEPRVVSLVEGFADATLENEAQQVALGAPTELRFDGEGAEGWRALQDVSGLRLEDGRLVGQTGARPVIILPPPEGLEPDDLLHAIQIRLRASAGTRLGVTFDPEEKLDEEALRADTRYNAFAALNTDLVPGDDLRTYTLTAANSSFDPSFPLARIRRILLRPTDVADAEFALESVRIVSRREHLASIPSGVGWHGLGDVYRETLVARAPERLVFPVTLPAAPYLEVALGTITPGPVRFAIALEPVGGGKSRVLAQRTVSTARRWEPVTVPLDELAGRDVRLVLSLGAAEPGSVGFWGGPVIRSRTAGEHMARRSRPRGVILILADTLRRDHLEPWGHERPTAPELGRLFEQGAVFRDAVAQGTWTKISVPSILTSLYPSTHGVVDMPDRIAASITTLAESYRNAGYATFATSSVPFSGKLSNLHQGVDVLHERASLPGTVDIAAKTARPFVDQLLPWLDAHRHVPFFVFLHVFDPHSPFEPYAPYETLWMDPDTIAEHRSDMKKVAEQIEEPFMKVQALPDQDEMDASGVDQERYVSHEKIWYDASIRAMDVEIGRVLERLDELGLGEDTLVAFVSDHGEEFLEHGRHFHGDTAYGEMLNVPLAFWWPGVVPGGVEVAETVQTIDLLPTLLELSGLPVPAEAQGRSLVPLFDTGRAAEWESQPAFAERALAPAAVAADARGEGRTSLVVIADGWKLIRNGDRPAGLPEFELFDHHADPLNLNDVAEQHPDVVQRLSALIDSWHAAATAARIEPDAAAGEISPEELQRLRSLGYVQ